MPKDSIDCLIVGAGFAGLVAAQQLTTRLGWKCVVIDQRHHIGGNAHDQIDDAGILVHTYEAYIGRPATENEFKTCLAGARENFPHPVNSEEVILAQVGREFYERFFEGYTSSTVNMDQVVGMALKGGMNSLPPLANASPMLYS